MSIVQSPRPLVALIAAMPQNSLDENAVEFYDDKHSEWEDRFLLLGVSANLRLLLICHCFKENDAVVRIISARMATAQEANFYKR